VDDETVEPATDLFDLARAGTTDELIGHLDAGVSVDVTDEAGNTLVMLAAYHEQADTVRALTARGADVNRANHNGQTPLSGAVFRDNNDIVSTLLAAGASPTLGMPSALQAAQYFGREAMLPVLIAHAQAGGQS
jgi:hypothetical protein